MPLLDFLKANETAIGARSEEKSSALTGEPRASEAPTSGFSAFFSQLLRVLEHAYADDPEIPAAGCLYDIEVTQSARALGIECHRLGYTLSHVVHTYGAIRQAITEIAAEQDITIRNEEFHVLNRCLDAAIAGAVTAFHAEVEDLTSRETHNLGVLAHELGNALAVVNTSLNLIKTGAVGFKGSVGQLMDRALQRQQQLIDRSLVEVRMRTDPEVCKEHISFFQLIDNVIISADAEARLKSQAFDVEIEPGLKIEADQYLLFSAVSTLLQNAIQHTSSGGLIRIRAHGSGNKAIIEIEDQRRAVNHVPANDPFQPFEQRYKSHDEAGPGLTIARRAVELNDGTIDVRNLPGNGCVFRINLPGMPSAASAA